MEKLSKESKNTLLSLVGFVLATPVVIWLRDLPGPPWDTSFLGQIGWYAGSIFQSLVNLFR